MPRNLVLFIDDGGVLNDNSIRGGEWLRLLGDFFPARLGGTARQWSEANRTVFQGLWDKWFTDRPLGGLPATYHEWSRAYQLDWLEQMAGHVGVPVPSDDDEALALAIEAACFVTLHCRSSYPDAAPGHQGAGGRGIHPLHRVWRGVAGAGRLPQGHGRA